MVWCSVLYFEDYDDMDVPFHFFQHKQRAQKICLPPRHSPRSQPMTVHFAAPHHFCGRLVYSHHHNHVFQKILSNHTISDDHHAVPNVLNVQESALARWPVRGPG